MKESDHGYNHNDKHQGMHDKHQDMKQNMHRNIQHDHHKNMVADFKKRFIVSTILTIPVLLLSELIQRFLRLEDILKFPGDKYILFALSTMIFFYGGWPFLKGVYDELKSKRLGMMTLIGMATKVFLICKL